MFDFDIIKSNTLLGESGFYLNKTNEIVFLDLHKLAFCLVFEQTEQDIDGFFDGFLQKERFLLLLYLYYLKKMKMMDLKKA